MLIGAMNHPAHDVFEELSWMVGMGLGHLDLTIEPPAASPEKIDVERLRKALDKHGMEIVGHTAFYAPIASGVERIRRAAVAELVAALEVFADLRCEWVNIHPDSQTHFYERHGNVARNLDSLRELVEAAARLGTNVMIENVPGMYNNAEQMGELLDEIPQLGLLLDVGHCSLRVPPKTSTAAEIIDRFADRIRHVHLHDNYGGNDDLHLPLGTGSVPYKEAIAQLKRHGYDGTITLEVFAPDKAYFELSRDRVKQAWDAA